LEATRKFALHTAQNIKNVKKLELDKVAATLGVKPRCGLDDMDTKTGEFKRQDAGWREWISSKKGSKFYAEPGRYHIYAAHACPWAHRAVITIALKGLEDVIGVTYVHPTWQFTKPGIDDHRGWIFGTSASSKESTNSKNHETLTAPSKSVLSNTDGVGAFPSDWGEIDPNFQSFSVRDLYERAEDTIGKYSVPIIWDTHLNTIVNNESSEIIRMLNSEFNAFAKHPNLDLFPHDDAKRKEIEAVNEWIYPTINNGVYRCGFAKTQNAYDIAIDELTKSFDKIESILQKQRFIAGKLLTEADVRLFVTMFRFDEVYIVYFKTNTRSVKTSPAILNYMREIYQMKGVADVCFMDKIKGHYFTSHVEYNKYSIVPKGADFVNLLLEPHNRNTLS